MVQVEPIGPEANPDDERRGEQALYRGRVAEEQVEDQPDCGDRDGQLQKLAEVRYAWLRPVRNDRDDQETEAERARGAAGGDSL